MDHDTQDYYEREAGSLAERYAGASGGISAWFDRAFSEGAKVLDVGAGSGRDLDRLLEGGWDAWGAEPCRALVEEARRRYPRVAGRMTEAGLPRLEGFGDGEYDGVVCSAVLMHILPEELEPALAGLCRVLRPGGRLLVSLPLDADGKAVELREPDGRLFSGLSPEGLEELICALGFALVTKGEGDDSLGRAGRRWVTLLFVLKDGEDQPESDSSAVSEDGTGSVR